MGSQTRAADQSGAGDVKAFIARQLRASLRNSLLAGQHFAEMALTLVVHTPN